MANKKRGIKYQLKNAAPSDEWSVYMEATGPFYAKKLKARRKVRRLREEYTGHDFKIARLPR